MNYEKLLSRAWQIPWQHKFLIGLGIIAGLFSFPGGGSYTMGDGQSGAPFVYGPTWNGGGLEAVVAIFAILAIAAIVLVIALAFWVVVTVARGGLVAGVAHVEEGQATGFGVAWRAGWQRLWPLLGISLVPAIPVILMLALSVVIFFPMMVVTGTGGRMDLAPGRLLAMGWAAFGFVTLCGGILLTLALGWLRMLAERACMLEGLGVWASYRRVLAVVSQNWGSAFILLVIQVGIGLVLAILAVFPGMLLVLCCILWPLLVVIRGAVTTYFSTLWTLAWREWTGMNAASVALAVGEDA